MSLIDKLWNSTPFWGIVGLIGGIIVASFFFLVGRKQKILEYQIISTPLITKSVSKISGLNVTIDDIPVKTLTSTTIHFFNMGSEKIELTDFASLEPLGIHVSGSILHSQLSANASGHHNRNLNLRLKSQEDQTINIEFDFFRPKGTFSVTILHEGQLLVHGELKEGKVRPYHSRTFSPDNLRIQILTSIIVSFVGFITSFIMGATLTQSLLFTGIIFMLVFCYSTLISAFNGSQLRVELLKLARPYEDEEDDEDDENI